MSFDALAPHYTWLEAVLAGRRLRRARLTWLAQLSGCERILIAGIGHGHFLRACARFLPDAEIVGVDSSAAMLRHAQRRAEREVASPHRLQFVQATLPDWVPTPGSFDAIVTPFFLDCFPPTVLAEVIRVLANAARPQRAHWLVTDFMVPERGWRRLRARAIHALMYAFFRPITGIEAQRVTPPDDLLRAQSFVLANRRYHDAQLIHADHWVRRRE